MIHEIEERMEIQAFFYVLWKMEKNMGGLKNICLFFN